MKTDFAGPGVAPLLPLSLIAVMPAPVGESPLAMALAWLLFMVVAGLPAAFLEAVLVRRGRDWPLQAMYPITRDSDLSTRWRLTPWLGLVAAVGLAALSAGGLAHTTPASPAWLSLGAPVGGVALALALAWVSSDRLTALGGLLALMALGVAIALDPPGFSLAPLSASGWRHAALLALICTGAGLGQHAWLVRRDAAGSIPSIILPFWLVQVVSGALACLVPAVSGTGLAPCLSAVPAIAGLVLLLQLVAGPLQARGLPRPAALGGAGAAVAALSLLADIPIFAKVTLTLALAGLVGLAVFTGWMMKISHVRKSLDFRSEGVYNLWRAAVRLAVPLMAVWALIGVWR